jgi:hypothetical protein
MVGSVTRGLSRRMRSGRCRPGSGVQEQREYEEEPQTHGTV